MDAKEFRDQAEYIWNRLDDLAKTDSDAYKKFIEKQMEDHKIFNSPPEPKICLFTKTLDEGAGYVFINVCAWKRIPYPENDEEPIKMFAGQISKKTAKGITEIILPVALNDKIYEECTDTDVNRNRLYEMIVSLAQDTLKTKLNQQYKKYKEIYRGDIPADSRTLFMTQRQLYNEDDIEKMATGTSINSPAELIKRISMMESQNKSNDEMHRFEKDIKIENAFKSKEAEKSERKNLIQEITEGDEEDRVQDKLPLETPKHLLEILPADDNHPARYVLKIKLPNVGGVMECDLNITEKSVDLTVTEKYFLSLNLGRIIDEDMSTAKFNKRNRQLTLSLPFKIS